MGGFPSQLIKAETKTTTATGAESTLPLDHVLLVKTPDESKRERAPAEVSSTESKPLESTMGQSFSNRERGLINLGHDAFYLTRVTTDIDLLEKAIKEKASSSARVNILLLLTSGAALVTSSILYAIDEDKRSILAAGIGVSGSFFLGGLARIKYKYPTVTDLSLRDKVSITIDAEQTGIPIDTGSRLDDTLLAFKNKQKELQNKVLGMMGFFSQPQTTASDFSAPSSTPAVL